jgi:hypothetical protein
MMHAVLARSNHNADKKPNTEARKARNNEETTEGNTHIGLVTSPKNGSHTKHSKSPQHKTDEKQPQQNT